jgi:hypothetical protein
MTNNFLLGYGGRGLHDVPEEERDDYVARRMAEVRTVSTPPQEWHRPEALRKFRPLAPTSGSQ